jgi:hypothetical protein
MVLKKREKILAITTAVVFLALAWYFFAPSSGPSLSELRQTRDAKLDELEQKQRRKRAGAKAAARLAEWEEHSLPADADSARSKYQDFLRDLIAQLGIRESKVDSPTGQHHQGVYTMLAFTVRAKVTLEQLVRFLYGFYAAGHLHLIHQMQIAPETKSRDLDVTISIQALSMSDIQRTEELSTAKPLRPLSASLADYQKVIVARNVFASYLPPEVPKPPPPVVKQPTFDHTQFAKVDAITEVDGRRQVWLDFLTLNKKFRLFEGEQFAVGTIRGTIVHINRNDVEIEMNGRRYLVPGGKSLHEGKPLEAAASPSAQAQAPATTP